MAKWTADNLASIEPMVRRVVARFKDMDTRDLEMGMLGYMVLHYEMMQDQQQLPAAEVQALRDENAALRREVARLEAMGDPGYWARGARYRATPGERAAYNAGRTTGRLSVLRERANLAPLPAPEYEI